MKKLEITPTKIYQFEIDPELHAHCVKVCDSIDWNSLNHRDNGVHFGKSTYGDTKLTSNSEWKPIVNFIEECANKVRETEDMDLLEKFKVSGIWANRSVNDEWHHKHSHGWSILSCILYIKGTNGRTWFSTMDEYTGSSSFPYRSTENEKCENIYRHTPEEGTAIFFPSTIQHSVDHCGADLRYTIAANLFGDGICGEVQGLRWTNLKVL